MVRKFRGIACIGLMNWSECRGIGLCGSSRVDCVIVVCQLLVVA